MNPKNSKYFQTAEDFDQALLALLAKKDFEYITVKELCKKTGVNRSTFYLHYQNMNDVLDETLSLLSHRFLSSFEKTDKPQELVLTTQKYLIPYLNFVKENKTAYQLAFEKPEVFHAVKKFNEMNREIFLPIMEKVNAPEERKPYLFEFYFKGVLSIIGLWVKRGCKEEIEIISSLIEDLTKINA